MTAGVLDVLIAGKLAGALSQDGAGSLSFAYERGYRGVPLSSSMPLSTRPYRDKVVLPYLWGLLPENPAARRHVAADADIPPNNPFALLGVIGLDCPGSAQFVPRGSDACRDEDKDLRDHGPIQAFSRTSRILNSVKTYGNIVCFRNLENSVNHAISLFGDKEAGGIMLLKLYAEYLGGIPRAFCSAARAVPSGGGSQRQRSLGRGGREGFHPPVWRGSALAQHPHGL